MNTVIIIQARTGSTRLPGKILRPFFGSQCILDILLERLKASGMKVILATSTADADDAVEEVGHAHGIKVCRGPEDDVVTRFLEATIDENCEHMIRICSDNPFLDLELLTQLASNVAASPDPVDYVAHRCGGKPSIATQYGVFAELVSRSALKRVIEQTDAGVYREHVTNYIHQRPDEFKIRYLDIDVSQFLAPWVRLTVDTPNDFAIASDLYSRVRMQSEEPLSWKSVKRVIDGDPQLQTQMAGQTELVDKQFLLQKVEEQT